MIARKASLLAMPVLAIALIASACSSAKTPAPPAQTSGPAATAPAEAKTRTITHAFGTTEIPVKPQRILAADDGVFIPTFGVLSALGVRPVAVVANQVPDYLSKYTEGVKVLPAPPSYEAMAALRPDLIITHGVEYNKKNYESVTKLAPAIAPTWYWQTLDQITAHWQAVGDAVGEKAKAEQLVTELHARIAKVRAKLEPAMKDKPVSVLQVQAPMNIFLQTGRLESSLLNAVGVPRPANQTYDPKNPQWYVQLSPERLVEADAWAIFVEVYAGSKSEIDSARKALEANPLWSKLGAVQNGRVFFVKTDEWSGTDPFVAQLALDAIERNLTPAVEKQ